MKNKSIEKKSNFSRPSSTSRQSAKIEQIFEKIHILNKDWRQKTRSSCKKKINYFHQLQSMNQEIDRESIQSYNSSSSSHLEDDHIHMFAGQ